MMPLFHCLSDLTDIHRRQIGACVGSGDEGLSYYAVAVARRDNPSVNFYTLKGKVACFAGEFINFFLIFAIFDDM